MNLFFLVVSAFLALLPWFGLRKQTQQPRRDPDDEDDDLHMGFIG